MASLTSIDRIFGQAVEAKAMPGIVALGVLQRVQVRAADPARQCPDEHLAGLRLRHRDIGHHERAVTHDGGAHLVFASQRPSWNVLT
jgi:hypothetical protein